MATVGNLELRVPGTVRYASVTTDGYEVYSSIIQLALLHDKSFEEGKKEPTRGDFVDWFKKIVPKIFHAEKVYPKPQGGVPCEVIIDVSRRVLIHNGDDSYYSGISETAEYTIAGAIDRLVHRHNYQIFELESLDSRQQRNKDRTPQAKP